MIAAAVLLIDGILDRHLGRWGAEDLAEEMLRAALSARHRKMPSADP
jgi:hypothetical protein